MSNQQSPFKAISLIFSYFLTAILIFLIAHYAAVHKVQFQSLRHLSLGKIGVLFLLVFAYKIIIGLRFKVMLDSFLLKLKLREWFGLSCIATMTNLILPAKAGLIPQAIYLKNKYHFDYHMFTVYLVSLAIFTFVLNSFCGTIFLLYNYLISGIFFYYLFWIFFLCSAMSVLLLIIMPRLSRMQLKLPLFNKIADSFKFFDKKKRLLLNLFILQIGDIIITGLRLYVVFSAIGIHVGVMPIFMVSLFTSISGVLAITPANLGIKELAITFSSLMIGQGIASGIMVSLIDRAIAAILTFILGFVYIPVLWHKDAR